MDAKRKLHRKIHSYARRIREEDILRANPIQQYGNKNQKSIPKFKSFQTQAQSQVNPDLYGDNNTRLFTFWTADADKHTGCYDLLCSSFIQVNNEIALGDTIEPFYVFGDTNSQYEITILI
ncbi:uncharacterized protein LOC114753844 [Neltuma alba]|uniref:uncharacterized protein LOC114753844 n=1 Tax=Neltuma alba TaxID=207710 RepID=UPI0010A34311|nr:uncharacterized protein LOC114753844 [Prosopis alba]